MSLEFTVSETIRASQKKLYNAWLNSEEHSKMIGAMALVSDIVGESFEAWDGYITGKNLELEPHNKILQSWRTSEFLESEEDSLLEIKFESKGDKTKITINHSILPEHGMQYKQGWIDNYFIPMIEYFEK